MDHVLTIIERKEIDIIFSDFNCFDDSVNKAKSISHKMIYSNHNILCVMF